MYYSFFCCEIIFTPFLCIVLASNRQIELLEQQGGFTFVDTTFKLIEKQYLLTTIMVQIQGTWGVPVAWLISSATITEVYSYFFRQLGAHCQTVHGYWPYSILSDFDLVIRAAATEVWSGVLFVGDLFHFMQANLRQRKKLDPKVCLFPLIKKDKRKKKPLIWSSYVGK